MKRVFLQFALLLILITDYCYAQSGWYNTFYNNTRTFSKIVQRDSSNLLALCGGITYYKSSDAGNTWQSFPQYSFDSTYSLFDGYFINNQTGWLIGANSQFYNGVILKTTNGGINWFKQSTGFNNFLCYSLSFINENTGWVGSSGGTVGYLLKTTNGGDNWTKQDFPSTYHIRKVKFLDNNNGWIVGLYNLVGRTTDGGATWINKQSNITCTNFSYLDVISMSECWVLSTCVGQAMVYSHFFKTTNSGDNWNLMHSYTDSLTTDGNSFSELNFINSNTGYSNGGFRFIFRTTNSGLNWDRINVTPVLGSYPTIGSLDYINNSIFAAGGYSGAGSYRPYNYILKSTNFGSNWEFKSYKYEYRFSRIFFANQTTGFATADSGKIFKTTNLGLNWYFIDSSNSFWLKDLAFNNFPNGYAIEGSGRILKTSNAGDNWFEVFNSPGRLFNLKFFNENSGFAGGDTNKLLKTTNGGLNWSFVSLSNITPFSIIDFSFINSNTGWALGHYYNGQPFQSYERNAFWKTTNSGENWNLIYDSLGFCNNFHIQFIDNNTGHKVSYNPYRMQKTTNGETNWFNINMPGGFRPFDLFFVNVNTGWMAGNNTQFSGKIFKTTDGGLNWLLQFEEYNKIAYSIFAFDQNNAWFSTDYSGIYKTTNGGGVIGMINISQNTPNNFNLRQNYPNPFNPETKIKFDVPKASFTKLVIYDLLGREVTTLVNEELKPGTYQADWNASSFSSGVYFYKIIVGDYTETKKMVLMK
jgi:photosystem II stability/assembly factor-like uncharacterized protein